MNKAKPILPRGFEDKEAQQLALSNKIISIIAKTYESYGFSALETPIIESSTALGKFLPDQDRPNAGVFSFIDDEEWVSLRYDLTAPLARYVAANFEKLPKPYKSYRYGPVFRNEKPGPGRFRQFIQFDADIVGAANLFADMQIFMMAADTLENLGVDSKQYVIKTNHRKLLDGLLESISINHSEHQEQRLHILRSIDKFDKFGIQGVAQLLGEGRLDESGDFTPGARLASQHIDRIINYLEFSQASQNISDLANIVGSNDLAQQAMEDLDQIQTMIEQFGYQDKIQIDTTIVRGLEYYTGPVFEAQLLFDVLNDDGKKVVFGSVAGGGRYDDLISRFMDAQVPATGFSIGVSRLIAGLSSMPGYRKSDDIKQPVVILKMDKDIEALKNYHIMAKNLRSAGIACEIYEGDSGMKAQMKYADRRGAKCVIIQGQREREQGLVQIKDLIEGARLSRDIEDNKVWRESRPAQMTTKIEQLVVNVKEILRRYDEN